MSFDADISDVEDEADDEWLLSESEPTELLGGLSGKTFDGLLLSLFAVAAVVVVVVFFVAVVSAKRMEPDDDELGLATLVDTAII